MRAPAALTLIVVGHPPLVASVDLDVGGVEIDGDLLAQRRGPRRRQRREHPGADVTDRGFDRVPLPVGERTRQPRRRGRAQPGHRRQYLPGHIGALAVEPDQEIFPGQLGCRDPDQQLPTAEAPIAGLDRPDRTVNSGITRSRSTSSVTTAILDTAVSDGSGALTRTRRRARPISRTSAQCRLCRPARYADVGEESLLGEPQQQPEGVAVRPAARRPSTGGRPKARRMLTQTTPTQDRLAEIFNLTQWTPGT